MPEGWYPHEPGDPFYDLIGCSCMSTLRFAAPLGVGVARGASVIGLEGYERVRHRPGALPTVGEGRVGRVRAEPDLMAP